VKAIQHLFSAPSSPDSLLPHSREEKKNEEGCKVGDETTRPTPLFYVHYLAQTIGPRGSTTPAEAQAADWAARELHRLGVSEVTIERFASPYSAWQPYALATGLGAAAGLLYPWARPWTALLAAFVSGLALWWAYRQLTFHQTPLRWPFGRRTSQNVIGRVPAREEPRRRAVLIAHLDTHRTPWFFQARWRLVLFVVGVNLIAIGLVINIGLYLLGAITHWLWVYPVTWGPGVLLALAAIACLAADATPFSPGANDNASAVGVVMSLASDLACNPLRHTEVWVVFTGCEEAGCYGMMDFLDRHGSELANAAFIDLEGVGAGQLRYSTWEGMIRRFPSHPDLVALANQVAQQHPEWPIKGVGLRAGFTEAGLIVARGYRGLCLIALDTGGFLPGWHQPGDTVENIEPEALERAQRFVAEMLALWDS